MKLLNLRKKSDDSDSIYNQIFKKTKKFVEKCTQTDFPDDKVSISLNLNFNDKKVYKEICDILDLYEMNSSKNNDRINFKVSMNDCYESA